MSRLIGGRGLFVALMAAALLATPLNTVAQERYRVVVSKEHTCGCCDAWIEHMRREGFLVSIMDTHDMAYIKKRFGISSDVASCHTASVGYYVLEGHVPAREVKRLLAERPEARGLAVPGMPIGSPGMEINGTAQEAYEVILFGPGGRQTYARYRGLHPR